VIKLETKHKEMYDLGWTTGFKFGINKLLNMKRPTKNDMRRLLKEQIEKEK